MKITTIQFLLLFSLLITQNGLADNLEANDDMSELFKATQALIEQQQRQNNEWMNRLLKQEETLAAEREERTKAHQSLIEEQKRQKEEQQEQYRQRREAIEAQHEERRRLQLEEANRRRAEAEAEYERREEERREARERSKREHEARVAEWRRMEEQREIERVEREIQRQADLARQAAEREEQELRKKEEREAARAEIERARREREKKRAEEQAERRRQYQIEVAERQAAAHQQVSNSQQSELEALGLSDSAEDIQLLAEAKAIVKMGIERMGERVENAPRQIYMEMLQHQVDKLRANPEYRKSGRVAQQINASSTPPHAAEQRVVQCKDCGGHYNVLPPGIINSTPTTCPRGGRHHVQWVPAR